MSEQIQIYSDGSSIGNPGPGGWASVICHGKRQRWISGGLACTTAAEMEITAAIRGLENASSACKTTVYSDSQYLIEGMRHLVPRWIRDGWRRRNGRLLKNRILWENLIDQCRGRDIEWVWVRGHNGHPQQSRADALAFMAARDQQMRMRAAA